MAFRPLKTIVQADVGRLRCNLRCLSPAFVLLLYSKEQISVWLRRKARAKTRRLPVPGLST